MIENDILSIQWPNGKATIDLRQFFPTSGRRTKQLFKKMICLDENRYEIAEDLIRWMQEQLDQYPESNLKIYANAYAESQTKVREIEEQVSAMQDRIDRDKQYLAAGMNENGKKLARAQLKKHKDMLAFLKARRSAVKERASWNKGYFKETESMRRLYTADIEAAKEFRI